jgi:hypothetical protein
MDVRGAMKRAMPHLAGDDLAVAEDPEGADRVNARSIAWALVALSCAVTAVVTAQHVPTSSAVAERVIRLTRGSSWKLTSAVPVAFRTHHPQGMVTIGTALFVSSVESTVPTRRLPHPEGGYDRTAGEGVGHLFQVDLGGRLLRSIRLGEGAVYHPGGLDFDGTHIWVPVAEYRPDSRSIVYRVDPATMAATEVFRFADHLGAVVHDTERRMLHAVSWGSRRIYGWRLDQSGKVLDPGTPRRALNPSHYVDYQDCQFAGAGRMLCTGLAELRDETSGRHVALGGLELIDLAEARPVHQVPLPLWTRTGLPMTRNPSWLEPTDSGLRAYFLPEDDESTLYVYEVETR